MSAKQTNAETFNPNRLNLSRVATYHRTIRAPVERVWENVLDWEHLPWLHETSFSYVDLDDAGEWGWRTWSDEPRTGFIELVVADETSYVARSYQAGAQGSEIWTYLAPEDNTTGIKVEFWMADVGDSSQHQLGDYMLSLYTRLWDEDEDMMVERQQRLTENRSADRERDLGDEAELRRLLAQGDTVVFQITRREFQLRLQGDTITAHSAICPHLLGPLTHNPIEGGTISCPWHGYEFDIASGECLSPGHANCRLPAPPDLLIESGRLIARSRH